MVFFRFNLDGLMDTKSFTAVSNSVTVINYARGNREIFFCFELFQTKTNITEVVPNNDLVLFLNYIG